MTDRNATEAQPTEAADSPRPPLFVINGDATPEEVAALTAVLQGLAAAGTGEPPRRPRSQWASPHRRLREPLHPGPGGWRTSALPR